MNSSALDSRDHGLEITTLNLNGPRFKSNFKSPYFTTYWNTNPPFFRILNISSKKYRQQRCDYIVKSDVHNMHVSECIKELYIGHRASYEAVQHQQFLPRDAMRINAVFVVAQCLSVRLSRSCVFYP